MNVGRLFIRVIIAIGAFWRRFMEVIGRKYYLQVRYVRNDGKEMALKIFWDSNESLRVLSTAAASSEGLTVISPDTNYKPKKVGPGLYEMVVKVKDLKTGRGPKDPSVWDN